MLHLAQTTRLGEEEGGTMTDPAEISALVALQPFITHPRDSPLLGTTPLSYWAACSVSVKPASGRLVELLLRHCGLTAGLAELVPALAQLTVIVRATRDCKPLRPH